MDPQFFQVNNEEDDGPCSALKEWLNKNQVTNLHIMATTSTTETIWCPICKYMTQYS
jgi:hypothetical protein